MNDVTTPYDLYIDLMDSAVYPYVNGIPGTKFIELYQNEAKASIFNIHISKNYEFLDLKDKTVRIGFKKPDDEIVWQPCTIVDAAKGKVQVVLEEQTLAVAGKIRAQVQVSDAENRSAESAVFYLYVHESVITKKAIQSTSAAPLLEDAIKAGELFKDYNVSDLAAIKPTAEAAQVSAEKAKTTADGSLPKTGGTMTGTLTSGSVYPMDFKGAKGQPNWTLRHLSSDGSLVFAPSKTPEGTDWDWTKQIVFHPVNGLQIFGGTNLYKKTDLYPSWLNWNGYTFNLAVNTDLNTVVKSGLYGGTGLVNAPTNIYLYVEVIAYHDVKYVLQRATSLAGGGASNQATWVRRMENGVWGAWERLIDSKGGNLTGELGINTANKGFTVGNGTDMLTQSVDLNGQYYWYSSKSKTPLRYDIPNDLLRILSPTAINGQVTFSGAAARLVFDVAAQSVTFDQPTTQISARGLLYREDGVTTGGIGRLRDASGSYSYMGWGASPWDMSTALVVNDKVFKYKNKDVAMRDKDGQVDLVVTANGEAFDTGTPNVARRRGNTVTIRLALKRVVGSTDNIVATIPPEMRPSTFMVTNALSTDGTVVRVTVEAAGNIKFSATDKSVYDTITYVVD